MNKQNLDYSGKPKGLGRTIGEHFDATDTPVIARDRTGRDQRNILLADLTSLADTAAETLDNLNNYMSYAAIAIPENSSLKEALKKEWPSEMGDVGDKIPFSLYRILEKKNTAGATKLKNHFLKRIKVSSYAAAIDTYSVMALILGEAERMRAFILEYMTSNRIDGRGQVYKIFQDWVDLAKKDLLDFWNHVVFEAPKLVDSIDGKVIDEITPTEAKSFQSSNQGKINAINSRIRMDLSYLNKSHGALADKFYKEFVGPAIAFHQNAYHSIDNTKVKAKQTPLTSHITDDIPVHQNNLRMAMADQMIRNDNYRTKIETIKYLMRARVSLIGEIETLSAVGSDYTPDVIDHEPTTTEVNLYKNYEGSQEDIYKASHLYLDDIDDDAAHPQYILRSGGSVTGDLTVAEGVKVDGVDISAHVHNGTDGSQKIDARDLVEGSLGIAIIDRDESVFTPQNLQFVSSSTRSSTSTALVDVTVSWLGDPANTFEFQLAQVKTHTNVEIENLFNILKPTAGDPIPESGYTNLWNLYNTTNGTTWIYFLSPDLDSDEAGDYESGGMYEGAYGNQILYNSASTDTATSSYYSSVLDTDILKDPRFPLPTYHSNMWVQTATGTSYITAGNKVYKVDPPADEATILKEFAATDEQTPSIYHMSISQDKETVYFFVKLSDFSNLTENSESTTIELWKIDSDEALTKVYTWNNEESVDKRYYAQGGVHGWLTSDVNDKDYALINTGIVYDGYIYGFCLYNIGSSEFYHTPELDNTTLPTFCRFNLTTMEKEIVQAHDGSYIICFGDADSLSPQPAVFDGDFYFPGSVVLTKETIDNATTVNSYGKISDGVFSREYVVTSDATKVHYRSVTTNPDADELYAVGVYEDASIAEGEPLGAIYKLAEV